MIMISDVVCDTVKKVSYHKQIAHQQQHSSLSNSMSVWSWVIKTSAPIVILANNAVWAEQTIEW